MAAVLDGGNAFPREAELPGPQELEVLVAEIENRARSTILRIIRPTLDQLGEISGKVEDLTAKVDLHGTLLGAAARLGEEVQYQMEMTNQVRDQIMKLESSHRVFENTTSSGIAGLTSAKHEVDQRVTELGRQQRKAERDIERAHAERATLQVTHDTAVRKIWDGITSSSRRMDVQKEEFLEILREREEKREELLEELYGEGKGLVKLAAEIQALVTFTAALPRMDKELEDSNEARAILERRMDELETASQTAQSRTDEFKRRIHQKLEDQSEEFRQLANELTAHHASLMRSIRGDYSLELELQQELRKNIEKFQGSTQNFCEEVKVELNTLARRVEAIWKELVTDMEEVHKRRKRERSLFDDDFKEVRVDLGRQQDQVGAAQASVEFLGRVLGLVIETEKLGSAINIQDFADRRSERWLSLPEEANRKPAQPMSAELLSKKRGQDMGKKQRGPTLEDFDWRKGVVKNEYIPGQVVYGGRDFDKQDVLLLHHQLLQKAHLAWEQGPPQLPKDQTTTVVTEQPGASGGTSSGHTPPSGGGGLFTSGPAIAGAQAVAGRLPGKDTFGPPPRKDPAKPPGSPRRQRPGSQGQPQGTGSRGIAQPQGLGDTTASVDREREREHDRDRVRLPAIPMSAR